MKSARPPSIAAMSALLATPVGLPHKNSTLKAFPNPTSPPKITLGPQSGSLIRLHFWLTHKWTRQNMSLASLCIISVDLILHEPVQRFS
jgi:hypothetical protein